MDRVQKKCLIASSGLHVVLLLVILFGSAFVPRAKPGKPVAALKLVHVPDILIDAPFVGGGGNPKLPQTEDRVKGTPTAPKRTEPAPPKPPTPTPPVAKQEPKPVEPKKKFELKAPDKPAKELPKREDILSRLQKDTRTAAERAADRARAKAQEEAKQAEAEVRQYANARQQAAKALGRSTEELQRGFQNGTKVEVGGPGGAAYADYALFVEKIYEEAWVVPNELTDEDATAKVVVVIARSGHVLSAKVQKRSRNASLDRSVERVLERVTFVAPFPEGSKDQERSFIINFNLKAKLLG